jgi:hypothetical protein
MASGDWIKLHRRLLESAVFNDEWLLRLWIWCLLRAGYCDRNIGGATIRAGSFVTGRFAASDELNVSPSRWYRGIHQLASLGMISLSASQERTIITVCKWDTYQSESDVHEQQVNNQRTASEQPADTSKEGQESKEGKKVKKLGGKPPKTPSGRKAGYAQGSVPIPVPLNASPNFAIAWKAWLEHRASIKKPYRSPQSENAQLETFQYWGVERAIAAIKYSLAGGYQGVFEDKNAPAPKESRIATAEDLATYRGGRASE